MQRRLDPIKCFSEAWDFFKDKPAVAVVGLVVYGGLAMLGQLIPLLGFLFGLLVLPVLGGGLFIFSLHLAGTDEPKIEDLFAGFEKYGRIMGVYWLYVAASIACMLPGIIVLAVSMVGHPGGFPSDIAIFVFILNMLAFVIFFLRFSMAFFIMVDEPEIGIIDVYRRSAQLTQGNRMNVFVVMLLMGAVGMLGALMFFVGLLVAMPITMIAYARAYLWLKSFHPPFRPAGAPLPDPQPTQPTQPREPVAGQ
jgi:hypothetical protein